jgi:hypothetical protein
LLTRGAASVCIAANYRTKHNETAMQGELIKEPNIMKQLIHYTNIYYEQIYTMNKNPWHFPVMQGELIFQGMPEKTIFFRKIL